MATIFFSYSHADEELRNQLANQLVILERQGVIDTWHDRKIGAGSEFAREIDRNIEQADIILLLVSSDFLASAYCYEREMACALERHESGTAIVIPVILRPCDWHGAPFGKLQAVPKDGKAVTLWPNRDEAMLDAARAVRAVAERLASQEVMREQAPNPDTSRGRPAEDPREQVLRQLLENPPPGRKWRKIETLSQSIGADAAETTRLLLKIGARRSTLANNVWAMPGPKTKPKVELI